MADDIAPQGYLPRVVDDEMRRALRTMPAVVVEGPRACGKTWTGRRFASSAVYLDERASAALDAGMDPASIRDLQVYARANRGSLSHYRDSDNLEVDLIVEHPDGKWVAAEVKLGGAAAIDRAARTLRRLRGKLDRAKTGDPAKLIVITAGGYAYERPDGVAVVPITSVGP